MPIRITSRVRSLASLLLLGGLLPCLSGGQVEGLQGATEVPEAEPPAILDGGRGEYFLLEWRGATAHPHHGYTGIRGLERAAREGALGLVEVRRRKVQGSWQLEQDVHFPFEEVRLLAVECLSRKSPRLVWREIFPGGGRTIFAEWTSESEELKAFEWGLDGSLREYHDTSRGAVMPQYLLELVRSGQAVGGRFEVFDPLIGALDIWSLDVTYQREHSDSDADDESGEYIRRAEFRRRDGTLAGLYRFAGTRLISFQWQEGDVVAKRISRIEYEQLSQRWGLDPEQAGADDGTRSAVKDV